MRLSNTGRVPVAEMRTATRGFAGSGGRHSQDCRSRTFSGDGREMASRGSPGRGLRVSRSGVP